MVDSPDVEATEVSPPPPAQESEGVPDPWFQAFTRANGIMPQTSMAIYIFLVDAILANPPEDWHSLLYVELSKGQLETLKVIKAKKHAKHEVESTPEVYDYKTKTVAVDEELMNTQLWEEHRDSSVIHLRVLVGLEKGTGLVEEEAALDFLGDPLNTQAVGRLSELFRAAREVFETEEVRDLTRRYRRVVSSRDRSNRSLIQDEIRDRVATRSKNIYPEVGGSQAFLNILG